VQPGQMAQKFIFVDKSTTLPQTCVCRVIDAHGNGDFITVQKVSNYGVKSID
jgi:hypothetical protein